VNYDPDEHLDDIFHRARAGLPLSLDEQRVRRAHLRLCVACRFLEDARAELLREELAPRPLDVGALVATVMTPSPRPTSDGGPSRIWSSFPVGPPRRLALAGARGAPPLTRKALAVAAALVFGAATGAAVAAHFMK
jgi:hypothetical protein